MNRILLLLDHKENRRLLAGWLASRYQVVPSDADETLDQPFDLGVFDATALDRLWEQVQARKRAEQPAFLPCLVVTARQDVGFVTRHLWKSVDELVINPIEKVELQARVEVLLRARRLSLELGKRVTELREIDRRKDEFLAMLGHELRNPLTPICNALHVLQRQGTEPQTIMWVHDITQRQVQHMTRLVDDLLDVTRIKRGKIQLRRQRFDLKQLVRNSVEDHRSALEAAGLILTRELPAEPVWVVGDPTRLAQVVGNLLHNAAKFTDPGGQLMVRVAVAEDQQHVAVTVRDTGIGIAADQLPRLFETFTQEDRTLDRNRGGLGLGLALVKGLIELHGGEVRAASAGAGQGAEFTFWLPLDRGAALPAESHAPSQPAGRCLRILVVEDYRDVAETLQKFLEFSGHEVAVAHSGSAGVEVARRIHPDVVLCDLGLPGMDGLEVARALRQDPATARARLITMSGYGSESDQRRCLEAGFELHLIKPVDPEELERVLAAR